jgi:hypothetical protein
MTPVSAAPGAPAVANGPAAIAESPPTTMAGLPVMGVRVEDPAVRQQIEMAARSDLEAARYTHWRGTVTFHDVASAWFNMADANLPDDLRSEFREIFPGLLDAFAEPRKGIVTAYFCRHIRVAAVLTDIGHAAGAPEGVPEATIKGPPPEGIKDLLPPEDTHPLHEDSPLAHRRRRRRQPFWRRCLHLFDPAPASSSAIHIEPTFGDPADWKAKEILFHCLHLHYKALEFLTPQPRKICMRMIFGVIATLLGTLDQRQLDMVSGKTDKPFGSNPDEIKTLERELAQAQAYYRQSAQRRDRRRHHRHARHARDARRPRRRDRRGRQRALAHVERQPQAQPRVREEDDPRARLHAPGDRRGVRRRRLPVPRRRDRRRPRPAGDRQPPRVLRRARLPVRVQRAVRPGRHRAGRA